MNNHKYVVTGDCAIFCTALVDSDPRRYQSWIDYYSDYFKGMSIDLYLFNDGPITTQLTLQGAQLITFDTPLGRESIWIFPGWKRSFSTAISELSKHYRYIAHIESDTILLQNGRDEFVRYLRAPGFRTGYTKRHAFIETALQILNTEQCRRFFTERYTSVESWYRYERFEKMVQYSLCPNIFMHGERIEERSINLSENYNYLSQFPIYQFNEVHPNGLVTGSKPDTITISKRWLRNGMLRSKWIFKNLMGRHG